MGAAERARPKRAVRSIANERTEERMTRYSIGIDFLVILPNVQWRADFFGKLEVRGVCLLNRVHFPDSLVSIQF